MIVSVPSKKLADEYQTNLTIEYPDLPLEVIHSDNVGDEKATIVIRSRLLADTSPRLTIITQTAFNILENRPFYHHASWIKIHDEFPPTFRMMTHDDPDDIKKILPFITVVVNDTDKEYYTLTCDVGLYKIAAERDELEIVPPLQEFCYQLLSTNYLNVFYKKH